MTDTFVDELDNIFKKGWLVERYGEKVEDWEKHLQLRIVYYDGVTETYPYTATYSMIKKDILSAINQARKEERQKVLELVNVERHIIDETLIEYPDDQSLLSQRELLKSLRQQIKEMG